MARSKDTLGETWGFTLPAGVQWQDIYVNAGGLFTRWGSHCLPSAVVLSCRAALLAVWACTVAWSLHDWADSYDRSYWIIKFTHWGATIELVYFMCLFMTTIVAMCGSRSQDSGVPVIVKVTWFLGSLMPAVTIFITVFYWGFAAAEPRLIQFAMHGLNYVLVVVDLLFTRQPLFLKHAWTSMLVGTVYAVFSYVYYVLGGLHPNMMSMYIYMRLDWNEGVVTLVLFVVAISVTGPVAHAMNWLLVRLATGRTTAELLHELGATQDAIAAGSTQAKVEEDPISSSV